MICALNITPRVASPKAFWNSRNLILFQLRAHLVPTAFKLTLLLNIKAVQACSLFYQPFLFAIQDAVLCKKGFEYALFQCFIATQHQQVWTENCYRFMTQCTVLMIATEMIIWSRYWVHGSLNCCSSAASLVLHQVQNADNIYKSSDNICDMG